QEIVEDDAFEVLNCDDKALTECQFTDAEMCSLLVLMNSQTSVSDSEEREEETQVED
ncbi:Transcription initiation factor IIB, partial [Araneus ventricosus]